MHWWLPLKGSTFAGDIDGLFLAILIITGIAFVVVEVGLIWFVIKYRQRPGRKAFYTHGNTRAEVIWSTSSAAPSCAAWATTACAPRCSCIRPRNTTPG